VYGVEDEDQRATVIERVVAALAALLADAAAIRAASGRGPR